MPFFFSLLGAPSPSVDGCSSSAPLEAGWSSDTGVRDAATQDTGLYGQLDSKSTSAASRARSPPGRAIYADSSRRMDVRDAGQASPTAPFWHVTWHPFAHSVRRSWCPVLMLRPGGCGRRSWARMSRLLAVRKELDSVRARRLQTSRTSIPCRSGGGNKRTSRRTACTLACWSASGRAEGTVAVLGCRG